MKDLYLFILALSTPYIFSLSVNNFLLLKFVAADQIPNPNPPAVDQIPNWHGLLVRERLRRKLSSKLKNSH